ncbi:transposase [Actinophytocola sp.]|uniref:transposase n=1 Tax=Actinophytocola sp. TaxID=1872138 RepID=UPI0039C87324
MPVDATAAAHAVLSGQATSTAKTGTGPVECCASSGWARASAVTSRTRPSTAALLIAAGDNPDRLDSDASFAALCGVSPIQASFGKTTRHRLNHRGDRQANAAPYRIAFTRLRCDPPTRSYLDRRTAQGKTRREAIRCIKRYLAREIHRLLQPLTPQAETTPRTG